MWSKLKRMITIIIISGLFFWLVLLLGMWQPSSSFGHDQGGNFYDIQKF